MKTKFTYKCYYEEDFGTEFKIIKKVLLTKQEFTEMSKNPLIDSDLIKENKKEMFVENNNVFHCLFVYCDEAEDGLLICSQGYDYARYIASYPKKAVL